MEIAYPRHNTTEDALHRLTCSIEASLARKEYTLTAFLDIEIAFNNVELIATNGNSLSQKAGY